VDENYLGARHPFDRAGWAAARAAFLAAPPGGRAGTHEALRAALRTLSDPYTRFVAPPDFAALTRYDVSGVGLNVGDDSGSPSGLSVLGVVLDSAAARAGVRQGDALLALEGRSLAGLSPFEASSAIQARPRGRPAELTVQTGGEPARQALLPPSPAPNDPGLFARLLQPPSSVSEQLQAGGVGVLALREFDGATARDAAAALARLRARGASSFVLDLRDCPGGLVSAGVEVARLFLPPDATVAYAAGRVQAAGGLAGAAPLRAPAGAAGPADAAALSLRPIAAGGAGRAAPERAPLAVLVNGRTASAAEIVAGALRDNCRAPLLGGRTFGKGLIQSVFELSDGSGLVVTVGTYARPSGESLDLRGLQPDAGAWPGMARAQELLAGCERPPPPAAAA